MKKMLSLILVLGILVCTFGVNSISAEPANQTARILAVNPDYRIMTTASGEERILDANNLVINQIIANVDQVLDVDAYNNGEVANFFGVEFVEITPLFEEEWIDAIVDEIGYKFSYLITVPYDSDIESAIEILENNEHVLAASQNAYSELKEDLDYDTQTAATSHYDLIGVSYAWEHGFVGSHDTLVSVIDTGAIEHTEFDNNMAFNLSFNATFPSTYPNGNDIEDVTPTHATKPYHGHMVAGIIGADYGDGGVNGICQNISMIPILIEGWSDQMNYAFQYSVAMGAKVINLSWGIPSGVLFNTIEDSDALLVVAADNANTLVTPSTYPMVCNAPDNCIVVSSSELNDTKVTGAAYSSTYVDIFAPGANVKSVGYPTGTRSGSGTSYATPMVAAAAALIRSHATHLTAEQTKNLILNNVDVVPALANYCVSGGRLAIDKAVDALYAEDRDEYSKGDVTGDGAITSMDKLFAQRIANGTMTATDDQFYAADVNKDGVVNTTDVDMILGFYYNTCYFPPV